MFALLALRALLTLRALFALLTLRALFALLALRALFALLALRALFALLALDIANQLPTVGCLLVYIAGIGIEIQIAPTATAFGRRTRTGQPGAALGKFHFDFHRFAGNKRVFPFIQLAVVDRLDGLSIDFDAAHAVIFGGPEGKRSFDALLDVIVGYRALPALRNRHVGVGVEHDFIDFLCLPVLKGIGGIRQNAVLNRQIGEYGIIVVVHKIFPRPVVCGGVILRAGRAARDDVCDAVRVHRRLFPCQHGRAGIDMVVTGQHEVDAALLEYGGKRADFRLVIVHGISAAVHQNDFKGFIRFGKDFAHQCDLLRITRVVRLIARLGIEVEYQGVARGKVVIAAGLPVRSVVGTVEEGGERRAVVRGIMVADGRRPQPRGQPGGKIVVDGIPFGNRLPGIRHVAREEGQIGGYQIFQLADNFGEYARAALDIAVDCNRDIAFGRGLKGFHRAAVLRVADGIVVNGIRLQPGEVCAPAEIFALDVFIHARHNFAYRAHADGILHVCIRGIQDVPRLRIVGRHPGDAGAAGSIFADGNGDSVGRGAAVGGVHLRFDQVAEQPVLFGADAVFHARIQHEFAEHEHPVGRYFIFLLDRRPGAARRFFDYKRHIGNDRAVLGYGNLRHVADRRTAHVHEIFIVERNVVSIQNQFGVDTDGVIRRILDERFDDLDARGALDRIFHLEIEENHVLFGRGKFVHAAQLEDDAPLLDRLFTDREALVDSRLSDER